MPETCLKGRTKVPLHWTGRQRDPNVQALQKGTLEGSGLRVSLLQKETLKGLGFRVYYEKGP